MIIFFFCFLTLNYYNFLRSKFFSLLLSKKNTLILNNYNNRFIFSLFILQFLKYFFMIINLFLENFIKENKNYFILSIFF